MGRGINDDALSYAQVTDNTRLIIAAIKLPYIIIFQAGHFQDNLSSQSFDWWKNQGLPNRSFGSN